MNENGVWIWRLSQVKDGDVTAAVQRLRQARVSWVAIKAGDSDAFVIGPNELTDRVMREFREAGIDVLAWHFIYCRDLYGIPDISEKDVAIRILEISAIAGLIVPAETDCEGRPQAAADYMRALRAAHPDDLVAYTMFPVIDYHVSFPYLEFGARADAAMPQVYWRDLGVSPARSVAWVKEQWERWHALWEEAGYQDAVKPVVLVGQGYDVSGAQIAEFCEATRRYGFEGISLFRHDTMTEED